jgi:hypothetical protein
VICGAKSGRRALCFKCNSSRKTIAKATSNNTSSKFHAFNVGVNCWVRNVTIDLLGSADE